MLKRGEKMYGTDVYADILFLVNFSMDYLCFYLTNGILHRKPRAFRMLLASVLGAFYAVAAVFLPVGEVTAFLADITVCAVMCAIVYAKRGEAFRNYLVSTGVYFGISALLGGLMTAFCSLLNHLGLPLEVIGKDGLSAWLFALLAAVSAAVAGTVGKFFRKSAGEQTATVGINCRGRRSQPARQGGQRKPAPRPSQREARDSDRASPGFGASSAGACRRDPPRGLYLGGFPIRVRRPAYPADSVTHGDRGRNADRDSSGTRHRDRFARNAGD